MKSGHPVGHNRVVLLAESTTEPQPEARWRDLPPRVKRRVILTGVLFGAIPWAAMVYLAAALIPALIVGYFLATVVLPFFLSLSHPLGGRAGARLGMYLVLAGWVWSAAFAGLSFGLNFIPGLDRFFAMHALFALVITTVLLPVLIVAARLAGAVGGYVPEEGVDESVEEGADDA